MAEFITFVSGKGGVGKTVLTSNIGAALSEMGKRVLLIDMDMGFRNLDIALGMENDIVYDLIDVFEGRCEIKDAVLQHEHYSNLSFLPAPQSRRHDSVDPEKMQELKSLIENDYDYIIFDSPAGAGLGFKNAVSVSDMVVVVATTETVSLRDADRIIDIIENEGIDKIMVIINRVMPDMMQAGHTLNVDDCLDILGIHLLGIVPEDKELFINYSEGKQVLESKNKKCISKQPIQNIARRIIGEEVPMTDFLKHKRTFFEKIKNFIAKN